MIQKKKNPLSEEQAQKKSRDISFGSMSFVNENMRKLFWLLLLSLLSLLPAGSVAAQKNLGAPLKAALTEVDRAFADYPKIRRFETLAKYPPLPDKEFAYFQNHYAPPIKNVIIETDQVAISRLRNISEPVFRLHAVEKRSQSVLLRGDIPSVFTWKLSFVSVTAAAFEILTDAEMTALVAHEIGHLYYADDLLQARTKSDDELARVTELKCDLIALETLRRLKLPETSLISAVEKLVKARTALHLESFQTGSPPLEDRRLLADKFARRAPPQLIKRKPSSNSNRSPAEIRLPKKKVLN